MFRLIPRAQHRITTVNHILTQPLIHHTIVGIILFVVFSLGVNTTRDLDWGPNGDFYRDVGFAQTILDGDYGKDPVYSDEKLWYNPLIPALIAGVSWVTDTPPHIAATRSGAYLNLLVPIAFYIMMLVMSRDSKIALATIVFFLFVAPGEYEATYSPWLLPSTFTQVLFYLTMASYIHAVRSGRFLMVCADRGFIRRVFFGAYRAGCAWWDHHTPGCSETNAA